MTALAGAAAEADADARLGEALARALEADEEERVRLGSRTDDAARLAARMWTVTATAEMAGLNVLTYLTAYFDASGRSGGKPLAGPDRERFLPWNAAPEDLHTWAKAPPHR